MARKQLPAPVAPSVPPSVPQVSHFTAPNLAAARRTIIDQCRQRAAQRFNAADVVADVLSEFSEDEAREILEMVR